MKEYSMEELINLYQSGRDTDHNKWFVPKYHRPFFWDETQQAAFIETVDHLVIDILKHYPKSTDI